MKVVQERRRLCDQDVVAQRREPGAVAKKLVTTIKGLGRRGDHFNKHHGIDQDITVMIVKARFTAHHDHIGIREHASGRLPLAPRR